MPNVNIFHPSIKTTAAQHLHFFIIDGDCDSHDDVSSTKPIVTVTTVDTETASSSLTISVTSVLLSTPELTIPKFTGNGSDKRRGHSSQLCCYCNEPHEPINCKKLSKIEARKQSLKKQGRCFNCLRRNHMARECK